MPNQNGTALDIETDAFDNPTRIVGNGMKVGFQYTIGQQNTAVSCDADTAEKMLFEMDLKAGLIEKNDVLKITPEFSFTNSANNKTLTVRVGGFTVFTKTRTSTTGESPLIELRSRNSLNSQRLPYGVSSTYSSGGYSGSNYSIDFSVDQKIQITGQKASAVDTLTLESVLVELKRGTNA